LGNKKKNDNRITEENRTPFFCIPYVKTVSEKFGNAIKKHNVRMAYSGLNKIRRFVHPHKDLLPNISRMNVVYRINCRDCDASYVGQTGRRLKTRLTEHCNHIKRNSVQNSVITDHRLQNHGFKWDEVEVLDNEPVLGKRLMSEMIFIKRQINGLNKQQDTENLNVAYQQIIENMPCLK